MSITAETAIDCTEPCTGCAGTKGAPLAAVVWVDSRAVMSKPVKLVLCEECGRDLANAVGFFCVRDGGWSKLEPRKRKTAAK
jgi:hypothetical protein